MHEPARLALEQDEPAIAAHAALEAYSVLTRLPPPHRAPVEAVARFLEDTFADRVYPLPESEYRGLVARFARYGITGGATYDALIAAVARFREAELLTCDERAARTYQRLGAVVSFVR